MSGKPEPWRPAYPGQRKPQWRWWKATDPELGLLGFLTRQDRDNFSKGKPGPFRRIVAADGRTILQGEDFRSMVRRLAHDAGVP
jgi:hypothetical protein